MDKKQFELDKRYLRMARIWAENSYCIRRKVSALIVKDKMIISDGYNGTPCGFENEAETVECTCKWVHGCIKTATPPDEVKSIDHCHLCSYAKLTTKPYVLHAEANAITKIAKSGNSSLGATLYVTTSPCLECSKLIIQSGIKRVVYCEKYRLDDGIKLLERAGIEVVYIEL